MFRARELPQATLNYVSLILKRLDLTNGHKFRNVDTLILFFLQIPTVCNHRKKLKKLIRKLYN